jgi:uncharacterized protein DUF5990
MKYEIPVRITVVQPVKGVTMQVQKGRDELVPPVSAGKDAAVFEFTISADSGGGGRPNFLGKFAQGPKDARFIYVNSGTYAGQTATCWARRAKISLMSITAEQVEEVLAKPGRVLETKIWGSSRDGGPMCATVPLLGGWTVGKAG